jgi:H+-translocating NAD(P) transhydrogenase subunit alpha
MTIALEPQVKTEQPQNIDRQKPKKVGIPKEIYPGECRVAGTPDTAKTLQKLGFDVVVQAGAGAAANYPDNAYAEAGCQIVDDASTLWATADLVLKVRPPEDSEIELIREGQTLISFISGTKPRIIAEIERSQSYSFGHGCSSPHQSRSKDGCPEFDG